MLFLGKMEVVFAQNILQTLFHNTAASQRLDDFVEHISLDPGEGGYLTNYVIANYVSFPNGGWDISPVLH